MIKKLILALAMSVATMGMALAQVDVNKADQAALESIKGLGPALSRKILDARQDGGNFKDWNDLEARVKGIKDKSALRLSEAGLTVAGKSRGEVAKAGASQDVKQARVAGKDSKSETRR